MCFKVRLSCLVFEVANGGRINSDVGVLIVLAVRVMLVLWLSLRVISGALRSPGYDNGASEVGFLTDELDSMKGICTLIVALEVGLLWLAEAFTIKEDEGGKIWCTVFLQFDDSDLGKSVGIAVGLTIGFNVSVIVGVTRSELLITIRSCIGIGEIPVVTSRNCSARRVPVTRSWTGIGGVLVVTGRSCTSACIPTHGGQRV